MPYMPSPFRRARRRFTVGLGGGALVVLGVILMPLPGPGTVVVIAGLAVLQTEYPAAGRLLERIKRPAVRWARSLSGRAGPPDDADRP